MQTKQEIINKFMSKGRLLSQDALEFIVNTSNTSFLENDYSSIILTADILRKAQHEGFKIIKNITEKPSTLTTNDFVRYSVSKFEKMKFIISSRLAKPYISLNKVTGFRSEIYTIGMIKDIREADSKILVDIEDLTASKTVSFNKEEHNNLGMLIIDDVVAIKATCTENILFGKDFYFPDIPIREPSRTYGKACFISDLHLNEIPKSDAEKFFSWFNMQDIQYLFVAGDIGDNEFFNVLVSNYCKEKKIIVIPGNSDSTNGTYPQQPIEMTNQKIITLSNPAIVELNGIKIILIHDFNRDMLRKRHLGNATLPLHEDYLALEDVPDIVHCGHTHEPHIENYKSVTIVNSGSMLSEFMPVVIDFATREAVNVKVN